MRMGNTVTIRAVPAQRARFGSNSGVWQVFSAAGLFFETHQSKAEVNESKAEASAAPQLQHAKSPTGLSR